MSGTLGVFCHHSTRVVVRAPGHTASSLCYLASLSQAFQLLLYHMPHLSQCSSNFHPPLPIFSAACLPSTNDTDVPSYFLSLGHVLPLLQTVFPSFKPEDPFSFQVPLRGPPLPFQAFQILSFFQTYSIEYSRASHSHLNTYLYKMQGHIPGKGVK